jgi:phage tail-like protein
MGLFKPIFQFHQDVAPEKAGSSLFTYTAGNIYYLLEVEGKAAGVFSAIEGGEIEVTVIEHPVTYETGNATILHIPGRTKFSPIKLTRGFVLNELTMYRWFAEASSGDIIQARRNGSLWMYGPQSKAGGDSRIVVAQWNFEGAWPSRISGFSFNQYQNAYIARVEITIVPEYIERVQ